MVAKEKMLYEVYICEHDGVVLYVGQGKIGRHAHCNSGCSHVYGLNRLHFGKVEFTTTVLGLFETKDEACDEEVRLIHKLKPKFNKVNSYEINKYNLYNKLFLDEQCYEQLKLHTTKDFYDEAVYDVETYISNASKLHFKNINGCFVVDEDLNSSDKGGYFQRELMKHTNVKMNSKKEVESFCYHLIMMGGDDFSRYEWRLFKPSDLDIMCMLKDTLCIIEYSSQYDN